jgi:molybdopterin-binding protein
MVPVRGVLTDWTVAGASGQVPGRRPADTESSTYRYGANTMTKLRIRDAARYLGVSDDTVRRLVDGGTFTRDVDASGRTVVDGAELAAHIRGRGEQLDDPSSTRSSARNRFVGIVTALTVDGVMAQVELQSGPHRVVSLMSAEAVHDLGLEVGAVAVASVKATMVSVEVPAEPAP